MSPTAKQPTDGGWSWTWQFEDLVTGQHIGIDLPNRSTRARWPRG